MNISIGPITLTIIFIVLKLTGCITWSWIWIFSPIWISALIIALVIGVILFLAVVAAILDI